jgi:hypothetical protein
MRRVTMRYVIWLGLEFRGPPDDDIDDQDRHDSRDRLVGLEVERERLAHHPAGDHHEGDDEDRDLHRGADGHPHGDLHLVLVGHHHLQGGRQESGRGTLHCIRKYYCTTELLVNLALLLVNLVRVVRGVGGNRPPSRAPPRSRQSG